MINWPIESLHDKITIKHGFPFKSEFFSDQETNYIVLTPGNFLEEGGFKRQAGKEKYYTGDIPEGYLHCKDDLIVAMTEQAAGLLGSCARVPESGVYLHNQRLGLIRANPEKASLEFIYHLFKTKTVREQIRASSSGSKVKHTSPQRIYDVKVPFPSLDEQKKIAKFLDAIEQKIELNNKMNAELEAMAKLIYDYWFVQFDFPDSDGKPYISSGGKMVYNEELKREIPEGWSAGTLNDLGQIVGGSTPSTSVAENFSADGTPWITPKDLSKNVGNKFISRGVENVSSAGIKSASLKVYPKGTVLMSSRAPIGYLAIARNNLTTNQGFKSFIPNKGFSSSFIFYTAIHVMKAIIQYSSGSTFKEVSGSTLKTVKVCLPNDELADLFTNRMSSIFERQNLAELENQRLTGLRNWLLPMLMNGQISI